jgi:hypothetical protein
MLGFFQITGAIAFRAEALPTWTTQNQDAAWLNEQLMPPKTEDPLNIILVSE